MFNSIYRSQIKALKKRLETVEFQSESRRLNIIDLEDLIDVMDGSIIFLNERLAEARRQVAGTQQVNQDLLSGAIQWKDETTNEWTSAKK